MILFLGISALPYLCWVVINFCLLAGVPSFSNLLGNALIDGGIWVRRHFPFIPPGVVTKTVVALAVICPALYGIIPLLLKVLAGAIVTAATSIGLSDIYLSRQSTVMGCFSRLKGRVGKVIYACAALCVTTGAGLILLIIPGIYWACRDGLAVPAVALEDIKGRQARARSAALTKGFLGRVFLIYICFALLEFAIRLAVRFVSEVIYPMAGKFAGILQPDTWVWMAAGLTITTPFIAIALTLAYYDQRVRLEAFNLDTMMSGAQQASPVSKAMGVTP
jgi:hypothetical protein